MVLEWLTPCWNVLYLCVCVWLAYCVFVGITTSVCEGRASQVALGLKNLPPNAGDIRDAGSIPELGRSPGGNPLQYSCLENPMDKGAWQDTVHSVAEWTQLKRLGTHASEDKQLTNTQTCECDISPWRRHQCLQSMFSWSLVRNKSVLNNNNNKITDHLMDL